jgi:hypothetical protein
MEVSMNAKRLLDRILHATAAAGPLTFLAVATAEGLLRADYDPIAQPISALAIGPRAFVQELNFVLLAAAFLAFAAVLRNALRPGMASIAAPGLFGLMALGVSVAAAFPMDAPSTPPTLTGRLHDVGGFLVFPWIPVVLLVLARRFRHDGDWRPYSRYTLLTGLFCLAMLLFFLVFVGPPSGSPRLASEYRGLTQRILLLPFFTWIALVARHAYRLASAGSFPSGAQRSAREAYGSG